MSDIVKARTDDPSLVVTSGEVAPRMNVSTAVASLRDDLESAIVNAEGNNSRVRFEDVEFELTLSVQAATESAGEAGIKFYVLNAGVSGTESQAATHTVTLRGKLVDADGEGDTRLSGTSLR